MTVITLLEARRYRSEEELHEVVLSGDAQRIRAACKRAEAADVDQALVEKVLAVAQQLGAEDADSSDDHSEPVEPVRPRMTGMARVRQLRAEQDLREAVLSRSTRRIEAGTKRALAAGIAQGSIKALLAAQEASL